VPERKVSIAVNTGSCQPKHSIFIGRTHIDELPAGLGKPG
jgi:hypothetical protein